MYRCCLIVVEDEVLLRLLMEMSLEATEYDFRVLSTAGSALEALEAEADRFDVLLTNVNLGDAAMTGFDLARRARELNPDILVVYMSGHAAHLFEREKVPGSIFLEKPIDTDRLLGILQNHCEEACERRA
jgi:DNA-binding NtrC family response regulator